MWDLIVSVPDHGLSFTLLYNSNAQVTRQLMKEFAANVDPGVLLYMHGTITYTLACVISTT